MNTTDLATVAQTAAANLNITEAVAESAAETYLAQMEAIDGRTIDPDEISEDDAAFLAAAITSAYAAGDLGR